MYRMPPSGLVQSFRYLTARSMTAVGTGMPAFRAARRAWSWVTVTDPSSQSPFSAADVYPHPPVDAWAFPQNSTALVKTRSSSFRRCSSSSSPYTHARNNSEYPCPCM
jgi:hypothetical protein